MLQIEQNTKLITTHTIQAFNTIVFRTEVEFSTHNRVFAQDVEMTDSFAVGGDQDDDVIMEDGWSTEAEDAAAVPVCEMAEVSGQFRRQPRANSMSACRAVFPFGLTMAQERIEGTLQPTPRILRTRLQRETSPLDQPYFCTLPVVHISPSFPFAPSNLSHCSHPPLFSIVPSFLFVPSFSLDRSSYRHTPHDHTSLRIFLFVIHFPNYANKHVSSSFRIYKLMTTD